jgi:hypothetical protein
MRKFLLMLGVLALICSPAMAGKNLGGAMVVHTDDTHSYTAGVCTLFDTWYPDISCEGLGTRTDMDDMTPALVWFLAAFPEAANPGVTVCYFGDDHPLPPYYIERWGFCGPAGSIEVPDTGWPDSPATAGNSVAFGSPIAGDHLFPFYYFTVYGYTDVYFCSAINPIGGYAGYVDDSNPPELDEIDRFGCVRWYADGFNDCPSPGPIPCACCFYDGTCQMTDDADACLAAGGYEFLGSGIPCNPNPCPQPGACCFDDGSCAPGYFEDRCYADGGVVWLIGDDCDPNNCPQPPEACCHDDGSCTFVPPAQCDGTPWGPGTTCTPDNPCPPPTGACCYEDGSCVPGTIEADCFAGGGTSWIMFDDCDPNICPPPPAEGACCYGCQECVVLLEADCEALPDWYLWLPDEVCDPNPCPPVATETTTWGSIKADYK